MVSKHPMPTISKILVATDFSDNAGLALSHAEELARKFGAEIIVLHVDQALAPVLINPEPGTGFDPGLFEAGERIAEERRLIAQRELDRAVNRLRESGLKARSILRVGAAFVEIIAAAQAEAVDLVVLGTHGRSGLAHILIGSVAERVVRKCPCPVLTVRHPSYKFKHPAEK
ncbi:MAG: universal stress protein [Candidatus Binataceae bacterium]|jgi:nucleotide-binding universal stress UspA family protein